MMKRLFCTLVASMISVAVFGLFASASENDSADTDEITAASAITAYCEPGTYGVSVSSFSIPVNDVSKYLTITPDDFSIKNAAVTDALWSDELKVTDVSFKDGWVLLDVEPFMLSCSRSDYMFWNMNKEPDENGLQFDFAPGDLEITCTASEDLCFSYNDISEVHTAIIDDFSDEDANGTPYKLFTPQENGEALPLVVWNHGGGCSEYGRQIIDDPFATSFADEHTQKYFPCYVVAPFYADTNAADTDRSNIVEAIQALIDAGKVDANRVYVTGQSMGSLMSFNYLYENPGFFAAVVGMNGGPSVNEDGTIVQNDPAWGAASAAFSHEALQLIADNGTAVMLVQGIGDPLSTPDKYAALYNELKSLNMSENKLIWHSYTAEQFNYLQDYTIEDTGFPVTDPITGATTYVADAFHGSNRPAAYDTFVKTWLFQQKKS